MSDYVDELKARGYGRGLPTKDVICKQHQKAYEDMSDKSKRLWLRRRLRASRHHGSGLAGLCPFESEELKRLGLV